MLQLNNKIVSYCRTAGVSEMAIAAQQNKIDKFCKDHSIVVINSYIDDGYSGLNFARPAFSRLMTDVASGKINGVIATGIDRVGRDYIQTMLMLRKFYELGKATFYFIDSESTSEDYLVSLAETKQNYCLPLWKEMLSESVICNRLAWRYT